MKSLQKLTSKIWSLVFELVCIVHLRMRISIHMFFF